jgi:hypothetical protein
LTINNSYGDGICCAEGLGSYSVTRNGVTFSGDGEFGLTGTIDICEGATPTTSPTGTPTKTPTSSPTKTPTSSPTKSPTLAPVTSPTPRNSDCLETETDVKLSILTDNYPEETQWTIVDWLSNAEVATSEPYRLKGAMFTEEMCIPKGCYVFTITDTNGDGVCCGYGSGSYYLFADGVSVIGNGGEFGSSGYSLFGNCQDIDIGASVAIADKKDKPRQKDNTRI